MNAPLSRADLAETIYAQLSPEVDDSGRAYLPYVESVDTITRLLSHTDGNGWQDIASAPNDGTEIVAHDAKTKTSHVTHWNGYGWHDPDSHYYSEAPDFEPTLWFPLPPVFPPMTEGESE